MARAEQTEIQMRIVIEQPVAGVLHSLQSKDDCPLDPKRSSAGEPLAFDFAIRVATRPEVLRRPGPPRRAERRFVYIRIGQSAGDPSSPGPAR